MKNKEEERLNFIVYQAIAKESKFGRTLCPLTRLGQVIVINKLDENKIAKEIRKIVMTSLNLKRAITTTEDIEDTVNEACIKVSQRSDLVFYTKKNECVVLVIECEYNREDADHFVMSKVR